MDCWGNSHLRDVNICVPLYYAPPPPRGADVFVVEASQVTEMLEANVIAPYKFKKVTPVDLAASFFMV